MKTTTSKFIWSVLVVLMMALTQASCSSDDNEAPRASKAAYRLEIVNLTASQPFSPPAVVIHTPGYQAWSIGSDASEGVEHLAEAGDASHFLSTAMADPDVISTGQVSDLVLPGAKGSITMESDWDVDLRISYAAMLVNTNDAFAGQMDVNIGDLSVGDSFRTSAVAYDAGTEANTETAATIPGPAGGGEGYSATADDHGFISVHSGLVTADDGLSGSILNESHRWLNPVAHLTVTRIQ